MEGRQYADVIFISIYAKMGIAGASHLNETFFMAHMETRFQLND